MNIFKRIFGTNVKSDLKVLKCKKDLYKRTYNKNAFTKDKEYTVVEVDNDFYYFLDDNGNEFNFSKTRTSIYYYIYDYFSHIT